VDLEKKSIREARAELTRLVNGEEPVIIERHHRRVAVLIPLQVGYFWGKERARADLLENRRRFNKAGKVLETER
jgi:hypothetical protein